MIKEFIFKKINKKVKEHEINENIKEGGLLSLAALIFGALGNAGGVANIVQSAKTSQKADVEKRSAEKQLKILKKENEKKIINWFFKKYSKKCRY